MSERATEEACGAMTLAEEVAYRIILLADHSKFVSPAFFEVARLDAVRDLITDEGTDEGVLDAIRQSGFARVHVV